MLETGYCPVNVAGRACLHCVSALPGGCSFAWRCSRCASRRGRLGRLLRARPMSSRCLCSRLALSVDVWSALQRWYRPCLGALHVDIAVNQSQCVASCLTVGRVTCACAWVKQTSQVRCIVLCLYDGAQKLSSMS